MRAGSFGAMTDAITDAITYALDDGVAAIRLDDGKVNSLPPASIDRLDALLTQAEEEAGALVLIGRPGTFSAGFDLATMTSGAEPMQALVAAGARLLARLYTSPLPVVVGCTGHALAMGALLLLVADTRIGPTEDAKIGLNEVAIGMTLPTFAVELARDRLSKRHFTAAVVQARLSSGADAVDVGYLDRLAPAAEIEAEAMAEARQLSELRRGAVRGTKQRARRATVDRMLDDLEADLADMAETTDTTG
jgi:enoyl-CoA hydratase